MPPNLLVGPGATDYAYDKGMPVLPNEYLVSSSSRDRWLRWKQDLQAADQKQVCDTAANSLRYADYDAIDHTGNTPPAFSPPTSPFSERRPSLRQLNTPTRPLAVSAADLPTAPTIGSDDLKGHPKSLFQPDTPMSSGPSSIDASRSANYNVQSDVAMDDKIQWHAKRQRTDGHLDGTAEDPEDHITDTVGAIAVDAWGNIAAGSSSGGIGMKHRGRTGPAALVGIGTAVVPVNPQDADRTCVATVTSGTGEHMATTMAAATCADRIYSSVMKAPGGGLVNCTEDEAMRGMIEREFMNHPGVRDSHCVGAIGVMAVKKTKDGIYLYFGHNTDSFALASMHSEERKPVCIMSRNTGAGAIAQGGRAARYRKGYGHS